MPSQTNVLQVYNELAECYARRGQAQMRDRFLVLAADAALSAGQTEEAEQLRLRLLQANPNHMLKPFASFGQARSAPDVDTYVRNLCLNYPLEVAEGLLRALRASDEPGAASGSRQQQQQQQTGPGSSRSDETDGTFSLDPDGDPGAATEWGADDDELERTAALPPGLILPPARPPKKDDDDDELAQTAHLPIPSPSRPRVPPKADPPRPEPPSRPAVPRQTTAPRSTAPSAVPPPRPAPPKPASAPRPVASKVPPRPAQGPSPFGPFGNDPAPPSAAPRRAKPPAEETPEGGSWLSTFLLGVVGLIGVGLMAYSVARPFLPKAWLP